jgi:hypothetical protein
METVLNDSSEIICHFSELSDEQKDFVLTTQTAKSTNGLMIKISYQEANPVIILGRIDGKQYFRIADESTKLMRLLIQKYI